jgi:CheY-like chemotaxis protein
MTAVLGFAQLLAADPSLGAVQRERVSTILRAGFDLLELIDEVLDLARIEAGRMTLQPATFNLDALLRDLEALFRSRAEGKGLQLLVERDEALPRFVVADEGKVRRVLTNLLGNAVKFTAHGGVALRVRVDAEEAGPLRLVAEVEDTGPGIALADQGRLFSPFDQTEAGARAGGSGLGLAISRQLARLMGGDVTLASEPGAGSRFRFEAVVGRGDAEDAVERKTGRRVVRLRDGTPPTRVMAVDDNADNRLFLRELLTRAGFEVQEAASGREALERFEVFRPHLVLMDMRMPDIDGYEATRRLKSSEAGRKAPVVAVTATAFEDGRRRVVEAGADAYVRKPFRAEELFAVLSRFLGVEYVYAGEGAEAGGESPRPPSLPPLSREQVAALPEELRARMRAAVVRGDGEAVLALLAQVEADDAVMASLASLVSGLRRLAESYENERLVELLGGEGTGEGRAGAALFRHSYLIENVAVAFGQRPNDSGFLWR